MLRLSSHKELGALLRKEANENELSTEDINDRNLSTKSGTITKQNGEI